MAHLATSSTYVYVIHRMAGMHCARGSQRCSKCTEAAKDFKWRLLRLHIEPTGHTMPIIQHKGSWHEFDVQRSFETEQEARTYADNNDEVTELIAQQHE